MINPTIQFMSKITQGDKVLEDKINYFVDCLDLYTHSLSFPLCSIKFDAKLLCQAIKKLLDSSNYKKLENINHYYYHYKELLDPNRLVNKNYSTLLTSLNSALTSLEALPVNNKSSYDSVPLTLLINELSEEFDNTYLSNVLAALKKAVFCREDLFQHDHIAVIEECTKIIIAEFYNIGYTKTEIRKVFDAAINYRFENFSTLTPGQIKDVPVPLEIYKYQNTESRTKYKNRVRKHLKISNLETQFNNVFYIFNQAQRDRTFIFKIGNLSIDGDDKLIYNNVTFSRSLKEKYISWKERKEFKDFFKEELKTSFCEVIVRSGYKLDALQKATLIVQDALNFIQYELSYINDDGLRKPYLDISQYVLVDLITTLNNRYDALRYTDSDKKYLEYIFELQNLKAHATVRNYLEIDKIFFEATSSLDKADSLANLWRYCEALFDTESASPSIIQRLTSYYCSKAPHTIYIGLQHMVFIFEGFFHHAPDAELASLGINRAQLTLLTNKEKHVKDYVNDLWTIIKHPVIDSLKGHIDSLNSTQSLDAITKHYYKILKAANINRNLYQHSNIIIDELVNIWYEQTLNFVGAVRRLIIEDLKNTPTIGKVEDLFPAYVNGPKIP